MTLIERLSPETQRQLNQAPTLEQREQRARDLVRALVMSRFAPPVTEAELLKFYAELKPDDPRRDRLEGLTGAQLNRELEWLYRWQRGGPPSGRWTRGGSGGRGGPTGQRGGPPPPAFGQPGPIPGPPPGSRDGRRDEGRRDEGRERSQQRSGDGKSSRERDGERVPPRPPQPPAEQPPAEQPPAEQPAAPSGAP